VNASPFGALERLEHTYIPTPKIAALRSSQLDYIPFLSSFFPQEGLEPPYRSSNPIAERKASSPQPRYRPGKDHAGILICATPSEPDLQIQPMHAGNENAVSPQGRRYKYRPYSAGDRKHHKLFRSKLLPAFGIRHTTATQPCRNRRTAEERAGQVRSK
jgi:hypothetical protein